MLVPSEFAKLAVVHGTTGTISDPHEIANVCGMEGVRFMIDNGNTVPFKFHFGAPSCVPATIFETAGASLDAGDVTELLAMPQIHYLSEMMNFPGVLQQDDEVMKKLLPPKIQQTGRWPCTRLAWRRCKNILKPVLVPIMNVLLPMKRSTN